VWKTVLANIENIDKFEDFFRNEVVFRRTVPNVATMRLFSEFPDEEPITLCFSMTMTASTLEEWQQNRSKTKWNDWEKTSYWLRATWPARFHSEFDINIESAIFEIYRAISMVNCDIFILRKNATEQIKASQLVDMWSTMDDSYFKN